MPDLDHALDSLATAAALGMDVPAIPGTRIWITAYRLPSSHTLTLQTETIATTRDKSITLLLATYGPTRPHFHDFDPTPWTRPAQPVDFNTWLKHHTPEQAALILFGPERGSHGTRRDGTWQTTPYTIT